MRWDHSEYLVLIYSAVLFSALLIVLVAKIKPGKMEGHGAKMKGYASFFGAFLVSLIFIASLSQQITSKTSNRSKYIGFGAWACGRQVEVGESSFAADIFESGNSSFIDQRIYLYNSDADEVDSSQLIEQSGLELSIVASGSEDANGRLEVKIPISDSFEFKISSKNGTDILAENLAYSEIDGAPSLKLTDGDVVCLDNSEWNIFILQTTNNDSYFSSKISPENFDSVKFDLSYLGSANESEQCLVLEYDSAKDFPEKACKDFLTKGLKLDKESSLINKALKPNEEQE